MWIWDACRYRMQDITASVVFKRNSSPRVSIAVDYFKNKTGNVISITQGSNVTIQKICEASNGTSPHCDLIIRPLPFANCTAANYPTAFLEIPQNAQVIYIKSTDVETKYARPTGNGNFAARILASYQPKLTTAQFVGAPVLNAPGTSALPVWRGTASIQNTIGDFSIDVQGRERSKVYCNADRSFVYTAPTPKAAAFTNLNLPVVSSRPPCSSISGTYSTRSYRGAVRARRCRVCSVASSTIQSVATSQSVLACAS